VTAANGSLLPEVWGGLECSVVRIGDRWRDQVRETGHYRRPDDLDRIAALGIRTLRYPVLWEQVAPEHPEAHRWHWHDERLYHMSRLGLRPIVGLLHHGSGPRYTDLLDAAFPAKLAAFAGHVAARYPWVKDWTPVNEPVTTARFSGLYGHWYPHASDLSSFCRMVVNQCRGILLAMRAIRRVIPDARLIQTEDLGRVFATSRLSYQAEHDNNRRWLSFDLLCGRVDRTHPFRRVLTEAGVTDAELAELHDGEGTPDILGVNHYLTSDRYLDHRTALYPPQFRGGNGRQSYADVEAVRILPHGELGWVARLSEAWRRYSRPVALTEVHLGDCAEEQVRWLIEAWQAAYELRRSGADIRAVTVWALAGSVDWDSLLLRRAGHYEPGCFDRNFDPPRATLLATAAASLAREGRFEHGVLDEEGWWRRQDRFHAAAMRV
jgi:dTDP-4-dehydrorhamnose reductase